MGNLDSVVGMATRYELDGSGLELRWGRSFLLQSVTATRLNQAPVQGVQVFPGFKVAGAWH